jgi:hypothetical protein
LAIGAILVLASGVEFRDALKIAPPTLRAEDLTHPGSKEAIVGFRVNIRRVIRLLELPGYAGWFAHSWDRICNEVADEILSSGWSMDEFACRQHEIYARVAWKIGEATAAWGASEKRLYDLFINNLEITSWSPPNEFPSKDDRISKPFAALLESVVIQAWTAFEVMAESVHSATLKNHSALFPANVLAKKAFHFRKLDNLFDAFQFAFSNDSAISSAVVNGDVKRAALLRHLLVHKKGVVDDSHILQCAQPPVVQPEAVKNVELKIVGELVFERLDPLIKRGCELIKAIDNWITYHP